MKFSCYVTVWQATVCDQSNAVLSCINSLGCVTEEPANIGHTYLQNGVYASDLMVLTLANILHLPITIFTTVPNWFCVWCQHLHLYFNTAFVVGIWWRCSWTLRHCNHERRHGINPEDTYQTIRLPTLLRQYTSGVLSLVDYGGAIML